MLSLVAGLCVYREAPTIRTAILSVAPYVRSVLVLDGRYEGMPYLEEDGMRARIEDLSLANVKYQECAPMRETEKRSKILEWALEEGAQWLLILDGDERLVCDDVASTFSRIKDLPLSKDVGWLWFTTNDPAHNLSRHVARIYRLWGGLHYEKKHDGLVDAMGDPVIDWRGYNAALKAGGGSYESTALRSWMSTGNNFLLRGASISSDGVVRSSERLKARATYFDELAKLES